MTSYIINAYTISAFLTSKVSSPILLPANIALNGARFACGYNIPSQLVSVRTLLLMTSIKPQCHLLAAPQAVTSLAFFTCKCLLHLPLSAATAPKLFIYPINLLEHKCFPLNAFEIWMWHHLRYPFVNAVHAHIVVLALSAPVQVHSLYVLHTGIASQQIVFLLGPLKPIRMQQMSLIAHYQVLWRIESRIYPTLNAAVILALVAVPIRLLLAILASIAGKGRRVEFLVIKTYSFWGPD